MTLLPLYETAAERYFPKWRKISLFFFVEVGLGAVEEGFEGSMRSCGEDSACLSVTVKVQWRLRVGMAGEGKLGTTALVA